MSYPSVLLSTVPLIKDFTLVEIDPEAIYYLHSYVYTR